jgi:hypothetical protein
MIDESHGKENLIYAIKAMYEKTPFIVMNDFRIAQATNSLRRVDLMKNIILN